MNKKLSYNGKTLNQMTIEELKQQILLNRTRMKLRTIFWILISIITFFVVPCLVEVPIVIGVVTDFWLLQNNKAIRYELGKRR